MLGRLVVEYLVRASQDSESVSQTAYKDSAGGFGRFVQYSKNDSLDNSSLVSVGKMALSSTETAATDDCRAAEAAAGNSRNSNAAARSSALPSSTCSALVSGRE